MARRAIDLLERSLQGIRDRLAPGGSEGAPSTPWEAYDRLAPWYDWSGALDFAESCVSLLDDVERSLGHRPRSHLDIACGTGTLLIHRARRGIACTGIDRSPSMLAVAQAKAMEAEVRPVLLCADLRHLPLSGGFDTVTCFYDVLNHLTDVADVSLALTMAARRLNPGGLFLFDTSNEAMYERQWDGGLQEIPMGDALVRVRYRYDRATRQGRAFLALDRPLGAPVTTRVAERCHSHGEIERAIRDAGLELSARIAHPHYGKDPANLKDLWVCRPR